MSDHAALLREFAEPFTPHSETWRLMIAAAEAIDAQAATIATLNAERDALDEALGNLLARIFRDGGHHAADLDMDNALREADAAVATMNCAADELREIAAMLPGEGSVVERVRELVDRRAASAAADMDYDEDVENGVVNQRGALIASPWYRPEKGCRVRSYYDDTAGSVDPDGWRAFSCMGRDAASLSGPETGAEGEAKVDAALAAWGVDLHQTDVWWFAPHKDEA